MAIGDDVKNTTYSNLQPARTHKRQLLRNVIEEALNQRNAQKPKSEEKAKKTKK
jgi:hypothetical protein